MSHGFQLIFDFFTTHVFDFFKLQVARSQKIFFRILQQAGEIPFFRIQLRISIGLHPLLDDVIHHRKDLVFHVFAFKDFSALVIDDFTLLVHDIIIFQDVLTNIKVACFDTFLCFLNGI